MKLCGLSQNLPWFANVQNVNFAEIVGGTSGGEADLCRNEGKGEIGPDAGAKWSTGVAVKSRGQIDRHHSRSRFVGGPPGNRSDGRSNRAPSRT